MGWALRRCHGLQTLRWPLLGANAVSCVFTSTELHCDSSVHSYAHMHTEALLDPYMWTHSIHTVDTLRTCFEMCSDTNAHASVYACVTCTPTHL